MFPAARPALLGKTLLAWRLTLDAGRELYFVSLQILPDTSSTAGPGIYTSAFIVAFLLKQGRKGYLLAANRSRSVDLTGLLNLIGIAVAVVCLSQAPASTNIQAGCLTYLTGLAAKTACLAFFIASSHAVRHIRDAPNAAPKLEASALDSEADFVGRRCSVLLAERRFAF